jgi:hypothetical protein
MPDALESVQAELIADEDAASPPTIETADDSGVWLLPPDTPIVAG